MEKFKTEIYTLEKATNSIFVIPTYQRPFVWGDEQINKLMDDFINAYLEQKEYFIGTVLTSKLNGTEELIDGQQRFTSLLLIAVAFKAEKIDSAILNFISTKNNEIRLGFAIRTKLKQYIELLVRDINLANQKFTDDDIKNDDYLINIARAISTIRNKLYNLPANIDKCKFGDFIYTKIKFVKNTSPANTDLNKLFATINNSGIQLEQTDILKSILLKYIKSDKFIYSRIWEACENMNNYFERNVRSLFPETDWSKLEFDSLKLFKNEHFTFIDKNKINSELNPKSFSINEIIASNDITEIEKIGLNIEYNAEQDTEEVVYCNSIINFSQLLLHTLRIFLKSKNKSDFQLPFHTKNLLQIFKELEDEKQDIREQNIKEFIECLWQVRFVFDKYVIKWIERPGENEKTLLLTTTAKSQKGNSYYFSRSYKEKDALSMLQSVLYFTSNYNTQIWLTPFLYYLINQDTETPLNLLEQIDNELSISSISDKETTFSLLNQLIANEKINLIEYLNQYLGTSFKHYWFQKLEYIIWKNWDKLKNGANEKNDRFKEYRITSKNSVEHIFPQNHEFGREINKNLLNSFGNLALLSVSQNSAYSNQDVKKKLVDFDYKQTFDSLKLAMFFDKLRKKDWSEQIIIEHQNEMINEIFKHYNIDDKAHNIL
ncbi:MAG: DUF262 domain-containing HNH endonuclease family protein [Limnohabitans sp.]|nr:DUF262 domain-containing HNH endonuclease family protein [Limnohabitans sp.]